MSEIQIEDFISYCAYLSHLDVRCRYIFKLCTSSSSSCFIFLLILCIYLDIYIYIEYKLIVVFSSTATLHILFLIRTQIYTWLPICINSKMVIDYQHQVFMQPVLSMSDICASDKLGQTVLRIVENGSY
jgi:hypothetical protein